jgi:hypothetical protein
MREENVMETNALPRYDSSDNPTSCCPRFNPDGWDGQELHFEDKPFVKATTRGIFHIPINMGSVFPKTFEAIEAANAVDTEQVIVMSIDPSAWRAEHYFAVTRDVPGQEMVRLSGNYMTKVFEGPYKNAPQWGKEMQAYVRSKGKQPGKVYFFYTTCPKCAKAYGKNYVVGIAEVMPGE